MKDKIKDNDLNKVTGGNQILEVNSQEKQGNSTPNKSLLDRMEELNRDLGVSPINSDMGTIAEENVIPNKDRERNS